MPTLTFVYLNKKERIEFINSNVLLNELLTIFATNNAISVIELNNVDIIYRGKYISKSLPFNLSGISNNITLELVNKEKVNNNIININKLIKPTSNPPSYIQSSTITSNVRLAIDIPPTNKRVLLNVNSSIKLIDILKLIEINENIKLSRYDENNNLLHIILIYLNREFYTLDDLKLNLVKLGIKNGTSCLLRINYRKFDVPALSLDDYQIEDEKEEIIDNNSSNVNNNDKSNPIQNNQNVIQSSTAPKIHALTQLLNDLEAEISSKDMTIKCLQSLSDIISNIGEEPKKLNVRTLKCSNVKFNERVGKWHNAINFLLDFAFESNETPPILTLPTIREPPQWLCRRVVELISNKIEKLNVSMDIEAVENSTSTITNFGNATQNIESSNVKPNEDGMEISPITKEADTTADNLKLINEFMTLSDQKELEGQNLNRIVGNLKTELLENFELISNYEELDELSQTVNQSWNAIIKLTQNLLTSPENPSFRTLKLSNNTFYSRMGRFKNALKFCCVCLGFESFNEELEYAPFESATIFQLTYENSKPALWLDRCVAVLKRNSDSCIEMFKQKNKILKEPAAPEIPADRNIIVIDGKSTQSALPSKLDDGDTSGDGSLILSSWKEDKRKAELTEKTAFMTREMREHIADSQKVKFLTTLIRIQLPGNITVQLTFLAVETIGELVNHLTSIFDGNVEPTDFYLLLPPSKKIKDTDYLSTFNSMSLVPAATFRLTPVGDIRLKSDLLNKKTNNVALNMPTATKVAQYEGIPSSVINLMPNLSVPVIEVKKTSVKNSDTDFDAEVERRARLLVGLGDNSKEKDSSAKKPKGNSMPSWFLNK